MFTVTILSSSDHSGTPVNRACSSFNVQAVIAQAMKACRESVGKLGIRRTFVISLLYWPLYLQVNSPPYSTNLTLGGPQSWYGRFEKQEGNADIPAVIQP
jgi:hypothetical protein